MSRRQPKVGFVSLGCPKALVDSERIITQLRAEGYQVAPELRRGGCRRREHLRLHRLGGGRIARCHRRGAGTERQGHRHRLPRRAARDAFSIGIRKVLKVTGPQAYEDVVSAVHEHLPPKHDPFVDLVPPQGIRLTPRHYAYLKISEGCNNKCSFCIIPSMRGLLASRPIDDVLREGEKLARAGVTRAAGDLAGHLGLRRGHPLPRSASGAGRNTKRDSSIWRAAWASSASGCACTTCIRIRTSTT